MKSSSIRKLEQFEQDIIDAEKRRDDLLKASIQAKKSAKGDEHDRNYHRLGKQIEKQRADYNRKLGQARNILINR